MFLGLGLRLTRLISAAVSAPPIFPGDSLLLEGGDYLLLETGDKLLLEA